MEDAASVAVQSILIVTKNVIVGEDLREIIEGLLEGSLVNIYRSLDDTWPTGHDVAIFGLPISTLLEDSRISEMQRSGTHIVVLNGHIPQETLQHSDIQVLSQPFRTEDVAGLLNDLGLLRRRG